MLADVTTLDATVVQLHTRMLNDQPRTQRFLSAIEQVVRPGDVVVDLGTGTGILAMAAARAGARKVYAIEAGPVGAVAQKLFAANGLADRIQLVAGYSTEIDLPERADVLVTETFGNSPLSEEVLEIVVDARRRLLKPDARVVPGSVRVFGTPVVVPAEELSQFVFTPECLEQWRRWYGVDFTPLGSVDRNALLTHWLDRAKVADWQPLAPTAPLIDIDLTALDDARVHGTADVTARDEGVLSGIAVHFDLHLSPSVAHSTDPRQSGPDNHWLVPIYFFVEPMDVRRGDVLRISYSYDPADKEEWIDVRLAS
ncbi:MAG: 50S ribosomal protein L11 methyltransferase [Gemmatimonadetes bacterium]|nr:50S ribosomal protein L11 methyltransferase [Gemmatimonadota bacterium]